LPKHANYGIDRPDLTLTLAVAGVTLLVLGLLPSIPSHSALIYGGIAFLVPLGIFAIMNPLKPIAARELLDSLEWRGNETVLDVGCGRGLWLITAAKHLTDGKAIGVDIWSRRLQSGNSPEKTLENARIEGVADRVEVQDARAQDLPFEEGTFDVVVSSLVVHHVPKTEQRKALQEMVRVLKPGGQLAMLEVFEQVEEYTKIFQEAGMTDVRTSWSKALFFLRYRTLRARKPLT
jgi:ubiquinone/menaquinone biosynthesis C-methylase UbiE